MDEIIHNFEHEQYHKMSKSKKEKWKSVKSFFSIIYQVLLCSMIVLSWLIYPCVPDSITVFLCILYLSFMVGTSLSMHKKRYIVAITILLFSLLTLLTKCILVYMLYTGKMHQYNRILWISFGITINSFQIDLEKWFETFSSDILISVISFYLFVYIRGRIRCMIKNQIDLQIIKRYQAGSTSYKVWVVIILTIMILTSMGNPSLYSLAITIFLCFWLYCFALNIEFELYIFYRASFFVMVLSTLYIIAAYILLIPFFTENTYTKWMSITGIVSSEDEGRYRTLPVYTSNILLYFSLLMYYKTRK